MKNKVLKDILIRDLKNFSLELFCNDLLLKMNNFKVSKDSSPHHQLQLLSTYLLKQLTFMRLIDVPLKKKIKRKALANQRST